MVFDAFYTAFLNCGVGSEEGEGKEDGKEVGGGGGGDIESF